MSPRVAIIAGLLLAGAVPARADVKADVKAGVEAWKAGDYAAAIGKWQAPADGGNADALFNLGQAYKLGRGVPADPARAIGYYRAAAAKGHQPAQASLGLLLFQGGDRTGAIPWIRKAAERGDPRAQYVLGTAYFNGDLVERDYARAYALMSRAAASGLPQAALSLAQMDRFIPAEQRRAGSTRAQRIAGAAPLTGVSAAGAGPVTSTTEATASPPQPSTPPAFPASSAQASIAPSSARGGAWRVQFGAFGNVESARKLWTSLRARTPMLADAEAFFIPANGITRLQAGPFASKAAADRACAALSGQPCFSLRP